MVKKIEELKFNCSAVDNYATTWQALDYNVVKQNRIKYIKKLQKEVDKYVQAHKAKAVIEYLKKEYRITKDDIDG